MATGYEIAGLSGDKVSSKVTHLTWRSTYRTFIWPQFKFAHRFQVGVRKHREYCQLE